MYLQKLARSTRYLICKIAKITKSIVLNCQVSTVREKYIVDKIDRIKAIDCDEQQDIGYCQTKELFSRTMTDVRRYFNVVNVFL